MALHPLFQPYRPSESDPFDSVKVAHLLNRAGFGGTLEEIEKVRKLGPKKAVDSLLDFPDLPAESAGGAGGPDLSSIAELPANFREYQRQLAAATPQDKKQLQMKFMQANREALAAIMLWWLDRMAFGAHPLQEKLTLFWHGHFTTSARDERSALLMWKQNELLRRYAAGNFEPFVHAVSRDPAMLDYLNNNQNRKQHPNENYARELMELFTLGIGNYTESDVKEAARAFTGWGHDGEEFVFRRFQHDASPKTFLGRTGNFDGDDIITMILLHPACRRFVAGELFKYLAYEDVDHDLVDALGDEFLAGRYEIRPLVRTILTSRAFYSPKCVGTQIKCPVQLVLGTIRMLGLAMPPERAMVSALDQMGQLPLMPPNVRGWPGGRQWINTSTLFIRYNACVYLAGGAAPALSRVGRKGDTSRPLPLRAAPPVDFEPDAAGSPQEIVQYWIDRLIPRPIAQDKIQVLLQALGRSTDSDAQRRVVQLIVSMPEYQLC